MPPRKDLTSEILALVRDLKDTVAEFRREYKEDIDGIRGELGGLRQLVTTHDALLSTRQSESENLRTIEKRVRELEVETATSSRALTEAEDEVETLRDKVTNLQIKMAVYSGGVGVVVAVVSFFANKYA
jgi:DNA repair exonuclease SbcCD ATPase subunit